MLTVFKKNIVSVVAITLTIVCMALLTQPMYYKDASRGDAELSSYGVVAEVIEIYDTYDSVFEIGGVYRLFGIAICLGQIITVLGIIKAVISILKAKPEKSASNLTAAFGLMFSLSLQIAFYYLANATWHGIDFQFTSIGKIFLVLTLITFILLVVGKITSKPKKLGTKNID